MPAIRHTHSRFIAAPAAQVRPALDALWSGAPGDAFPFEQIRPWRRVPEGATAFSLGTRFGHGPYRFVVDRCDDREVSARIETAGYDGSHGFALVEEEGGTRVVHDLSASVATKDWLVWTLLVGAAHDWAVTACLARLEGLVTRGHADALEAPWQLRAFIGLRRIVKNGLKH